MVDQKAAEKSRRLSKNGSVSTRTERKQTAWKGHEVLIATHIDKGHIHTHFIVNSVNYENGHKLQWSKHDLKDLKERCNEQSREQGFSSAFFEGKKIPCISLKGQKVFHSGYELRDKDVHDISILEGLSE